MDKSIISSTDPITVLCFHNLTFRQNRRKRVRRPPSQPFLKEYIPWFLRFIEKKIFWGTTKHLLLKKRFQAMKYKIRTIIQILFRFENNIGGVLSNEPAFKPKARPATKRFASIVAQSGARPK